MPMGNDKATERLRAAIDKMLKDRGTKAGIGPPMAYFEQVHDANAPEPRTRWIYQSFNAAGPKDQGRAYDGPPIDTYPELEAAVLPSFGAWLKPGGTVVWRAVPEAEMQKELWFAYLRCVQLPDQPEEIIIGWNL